MKYKYLDKVRIKSGFYEGQVGILTDCFETEKKYEVKLCDKRSDGDLLHKTIMVREEDLEKLEEV